MAKIAFVGAGSIGFTRTLVTDLMSYEKLTDTTISLIDIDKERLSYAEGAVRRILKQGGFPATVTSTTDIATGVAGADIVIITILAHGVEGFRPEIEIPMRYGVDFCVGDSYGTAGVFRALRTIPIMLAICREIEREAPSAYVLNYTNPMTMLCRALQRATTVKLVGLCHSVQSLIPRLARWIEAPLDEIVYQCAGINHQAWVLRLEWKGEDAYPLLRQAIENPEIWRRDIVRNEIFRALGYYVTETSGHNSEYVWWFRKRPDLIEKYCSEGEIIPGAHAYTLKHYERTAQSWQRELRGYAEGREEIKLDRSEEYASRIIHSLLGGEQCVFNATVPNQGAITNLPFDAAVEVPVLANQSGFQTLQVGSLPPQCAVLNQLHTTIIELAVEAALTGNRDPVYHACYLDPVAAAKCSLAEIRNMVDDLFEVQLSLMPQFHAT